MIGKKVLLWTVIALLTVLDLGCAAVPLTYQEVIEKNGEPNEIFDRPDGSRVLIYKSQAPLYYQNQYFVIRDETVVEGGLDFEGLNLHFVSPL
ncbi:MAG: hypothetical protein V1816_09870 [Pseudomonadota bacterium]